MSFLLLSRSTSTLAAFLLMALSSSSAFAADLAITYDGSGLPRCVTDPSDSRNGVLLLWDEKVAEVRHLYTRPLSDIPAIAQGAINPEGQSCENWQVYTQVAKNDMLWRRMARIENRYAVTFANGASRDLPVELASKIYQIRLGANVYHSEQTGAEFLRNHPISEFTRALNRQLTRSYGVGFTADIYKAYLEAKSQNSTIQGKIRQELTRLSRNERAVTGQLRKDLSKYVILFAQGYMQTPARNRGQELFDELNAAGARLQVMNFDPLGLLAANAAGFKAQILERLQAGDKVILAGASKGVPEMLTALAEIQREQPGLAQNVKAVISLAGMYDGSFLVDWADQFPQSLFVGKTLRPQAAMVGLNMENADGFFAMSSESLAKQGSLYNTNLPRSLPYYNFVGVLTKDGITRDREIRQLQTDLVPQTNAHGANDGYIEYPGTTMPARYGLNSVDVVFDSSHAILDGHYNGLDMQVPAQRRSVILSIFSVIFTEVEAGSR